jgi:hypothetical protein
MRWSCQEQSSLRYTYSSSLAHECRLCPVAMRHAPLTYALLEVTCWSSILLTLGIRCYSCQRLQGDELRSTRKECSARATKLQKLSEEKTRASQLAVEADQLKVSYC